MGNYILQTIVFQLVFLLAYELLLKKETFFTYNRIYLLLSPVVALLLPLLNFPVLQSAVPAETVVLLPEVFLGTKPTPEIISEVPLTIGETNVISWLWLCYGIGVLGSIVFFLKKYTALKRLFKNPVISEAEDFRIISLPDSDLACTFFNTIFLGDRLQEKEAEQILSHELVHVKQRHSFDLLFFELLKILFWFNPLIYIYQSRISVLHEFIADEGVVKKIKKQDYFQQILNTAFGTSNISFVNQFFNHSITRLTVFGRTIAFGNSGGQVKKRIVMLQKSRSKTIAKFKYLTPLPLMLVMLTYVACSDDDSQIKDSSLDLSKFTYTVSKSGDMDANTQKQHEEYETFLLENKGYVGWGTIDLAAQEVTYSVHSKDEPVPGDFVELKVNKPGGREYIFYMNLPNNKAANSKSSVEVETTDSSARGNGDVPFAVIEEVPVFPGCESLATNQERKDCMVQNIIDVVNKNFNTALGKELGLSGVNRIYVQFKITSQGDVEVMGVRAPKPELEEEARRVVNLLPQMTPGKQDGKEVGVLYSLPITFRVGE